CDRNLMTYIGEDRRWRVAHVWPITMGGPHLDFEMWDTMNLNKRALVLSNSAFRSFPGLKIQTWATHRSWLVEKWATRQGVLVMASLRYIPALLQQRVRII